MTARPTRRSPTRNAPTARTPASVAGPAAPDTAIVVGRDRQRRVDVTLVHGSPIDPIWGYIEDEQDAIENMQFFETSFCLFGHTHYPISYWLREKERILRVESLPERSPYLMERKLLLNVGSAGQPRDGDPRAAFGILNTDSKTITQYRIEYDIGAVQRAIRDAALPHRLAERLAYGN